MLLFLMNFNQLYNSFTDQMKANPVIELKTLFAQLINHIELLLQMRN